MEFICGSTKKTKTTTNRQTHGALELPQRILNNGKLLLKYN